jgi:hypothetical protein
MKVSTDSTRMKSQLYVMAWVGKVVRGVLESRPSSWVLLSQSLHSNPRRRGGSFPYLLRPLRAPEEHLCS